RRGIGRRVPPRRNSSMNRPIEELRAGQDCGHDLLDSKIEAPAAVTRSASPGIIEGHQAVHIFRGYWPSERPARQVFGNLPRARGLAGGLYLHPVGLALRRITDEDQCAAGSPRNARRVIWPDDFDAVAKTRHAAVAGAEPKSANAAESGGDILVGFHVGTVDEGDNHVAHTGFNLYGNFRKARHDLVAPRRSLAIRESLIRGPANRLTKHDLAVDHDDHRAFVFDCRGVQA